MAFKLNKDVLAKSAKCPTGMHIATLTEVEDTYFSEKGTEVQKANFETDKGYNIPMWFNGSDMGLGQILEFVQAADDVTFTADNMAELDINLKEYVGKKVCLSVSHGKDKNNKVQAQIDNFFSAKKVPF
jgi:hypothetical protein